MANKHITSPQQDTAENADFGSEQIDEKIATLADWRGETRTFIREVIRDADPEVIEDIKWRKPTNPAGVPVWSHAGILCTGETYKDKIKLTFAKGTSLPDPARLFSSSLDAGTRRAIDIRNGDPIDGKALKALIRAAVLSNTAKP